MLGVFLGIFPLIFLRVLGGFLQMMIIPKRLLLFRMQGLIGGKHTVMAKRTDEYIQAINDVLNKFYRKTPIEQVKDITKFNDVLNVCMIELQLHPDWISEFLERSGWMRGRILSIISEVPKAFDKGLLRESEVTPIRRGWEELHNRILCFEGRYKLDSYILYIEHKRPLEEQFYLPRRKTLKQVVDAYQDIEDGKLDELFIHMPPRVGKTQIATFAMAWHVARDMLTSNLYATYKEGLGGAFIQGVKELWTDPEYLHKDVFPETAIVGTNAQDNTIDLGKPKKYKSLSGKGLTSGLNGQYDAKGWILCDDLLEGIQDALNPDILIRKQKLFDNNLMSRKKSKCKVIYNGTLWSIHDIFSNRLRLLEEHPEFQTRYKVICIPALDPVTDQSNFDYDYGVGFTTLDYHKIRTSFEENDDMASFLACYQQNPIEREGAVFNPQHMNFYNGELPTEGLLKVIAACDVALGGADYLSMPIAYIYEDGTGYVHDVVFSNEGKGITKPEVVKKIIEHGVKHAFFEANQGGEGYKDEINSLLEEKNYKCTLVSKYAPTNKRKEQRIWDEADEIRKLYFLDAGHRTLAYRKFMLNLFEFTMFGKNKHEDAPDSLSMLTKFNRSGSGLNARVTVVSRAALGI